MDGRAPLVALAVVLAGCAGLGATVPAGTDGSATAPPTVGSDSRTATDGRMATVVEVVDGDTVDVRYPNGSTGRVRLLGVDTPEVSGDNDPAEFEGVPDTDEGESCLRALGDDATDALAERVDGRRVQVVVDPTADRRDRYGRLLAYIVHDGVDLNRWLVETGYARVYDSTFARSDEYYAVESAAQAEGVGVWQCRSPTTVTPASASDLAVVRVHADAAGNDHENLDDEYVVFANAGEATLDIGGWTVADEAGHTYTFPQETTLAPDERVTLYTGSGTDGDGSRYWGLESAVWNNGGDTVTVRRPDGTIALSHGYE